MKPAASAPRRQLAIGPPAADFASAAMLRLVAAGLRRQGLVASPAAPARSAVVPLQDKRGLLEGLWQRHGPAVLLRIGEALPDMNNEPTLLALALAQGPHDLIRRWQRLERFVHSRHRVVVTQAGERFLLLRHVSMMAGSPPTQAEHVLVLGVLAALADYIGTAQCRVRLAGERGWRRAGTHWDLQAWPADASGWEFEWQVLPQPAAVMPSPPAADCLGAAQALLSRDPGRVWTLPLLASSLATTPRTLQRRLGAAGSGFNALLVAARTGRAAHLLAMSRMPAAEIGYLCGFSDQAHFTRQFKRSTAVTPLAYRREFGTGGALAPGV